jgi:hypothetical protein
MTRSLQVLFRRDATRDRQENRVQFEGYELMWPDGRRVAVGFDALCRHGQRLLGLGRYLGGRTELFVEMLCCPLTGMEDDLTRVPGARVRRFFIERLGSQGRLHFMDGTPTTIVLDLERDEWPVLQWIGMDVLPDGQRAWFDLAARPVEHPARPVPAMPGLSMPFSRDAVV